ncbi:hypothetical protein BU26DRAFT_516531 [Trematosphaeria pertusa]|uniref:Uncharacterized protein n=1 Tax=Trematosphaeria pertusa TaxID=390896 RepID=A0A6A6IN08_9PLEO|nr:uncharacterized protein BU26DRAFT_516531 [Trematosphaeria pertusa]KAF2251776.1 hypothetical protein BU26DRAFT_516531 [Trematosphaeria pertusa]
MKSASTLLLAGAAAAYEYGYTSSSEVGYTTITPGGSYAPVTVTSQYQPIPTYDSEHSSYSSYLYVSTIITDADGNQCTITKTEEPVTVAHYKSTITHTTVATDYGYAVPTGYYPSGRKNATSTPVYRTKSWEELYEKIDKVPYKELGPSALPNYPGSGLCGSECYGEEDTKYQPVEVSEYSNGKWSTYRETHTYGAPKPSVKTYDTPGTYTVPEYDMTVHKSTTVPAEATYTAPPGKTVTYGGSTTDVAHPTTITAAYGAYETHGTKTKTVIKYVTITATKPGKYTIAKPTTTHYETERECHYPTAQVYPPGVYHHSKETVTITKSHEAYTCSYHKTSTYPSPSSTPSVTKDSYPTTTSSHDTYPTETSSTKGDEYPTPSSTTPYGPDPSSDYEEPAESYGTPSAGYVKRGGMLERRKAEAPAKKAAPVGKRVILV